MLTGSHSPLEMLFGLGEAAPGWQTGSALVLFLLVGVLWAWVRGHHERMRYGGALAFLAAAFALEAVVPWMPAAWVSTSVLRAVSLLAFFFGLVRAAAVTVDLWARRYQRDFSSIFRDLATVLLYGVVVLIVARTALNVDVTPLLATSALVTAVIGLALQETLGNVFSGLSLQMQKPFEPGDWVRFQSHLGRVQGIGWRSTRLVTRSLEVLDVPNGLLAKEVITNYRGTAVGDELFVGVSYAAPPSHVKEVILDVLRHNHDLAKQPPPQVWVVDYGDFAIKYRIRFWMIDFSRQDAVRDSIMGALWYTFRRNGIEIPFPIRTLHVQRSSARGGEGDSKQRERMAALRRVDFLSELGEDELAVLVPNLHEVVFGRGEVICREGDPGETFYVIREGTAEVLAHGPGGQEKHVADLHVGAFFGEMSLLTGEPRTATVRGKTDLRLLVVEREGFESLFRARPSIAEAVSLVICARKGELRERREQIAATESAESRSRRLLARMRSIFTF